MKKSKEFQQKKLNRIVSVIINRKRYLPGHTKYWIYKKGNAMKKENCIASKGLVHLLTFCFLYVITIVLVFGCGDSVHTDFSGSGRCEDDLCVTWRFDPDSYVVDSNEEVSVYGVVSNISEEENLEVSSVLKGADIEASIEEEDSLRNYFDVDYILDEPDPADVVLKPEEEWRFLWAVLRPRVEEVPSGTYNLTNASIKGFDSSGEINSDNLFTVTVVTDE